MENSLPLVTIAVINYNGAHYVKDCLNSIFSIDYPDFEVIFLDNGSDDDSVSLAKAYFPNIRVIENSVNSGPSGARNICLIEAKTDFVLLLDVDVDISKSTLKHLVLAYQSVTDRDVAVVHPRVVYADEPDKIQYDGCDIHYLGVMMHHNRNKQISKAPSNLRQIYSCDNVAALVDKKVIMDSGLYDEDFFFGFEDAEFVLRATLAGKQCIQASHVIVCHKGGTAGISMRKGNDYSKLRAFHVTKNRAYFIFKLYSWKTIFFIFPALLIYELMAFLFMVKNKNTIAYFKGLYKFSSSFFGLLKKRYAFQRLKVVSDREFLRSGSFTYASGTIQGGIVEKAVRISEKIFNAYWKVIYRLI